MKTREEIFISSRDTFFAWGFLFLEEGGGGGVEKDTHIESMNWDRSTR